MDLNMLKVLSFGELRSQYKDFLKKQNLSQATINTAYSDTFYLWRHGSQELFWSVVTGDDFPESARTELVEMLSKHSAGNANQLASGYVSHLNRFRQFLGFDAVHSAAVSMPLKMKESAKERIIQTGVPTPTADEVEKYLAKWDSLESYRLQEEALNRLFFDLCPNNTDILDILLKTSALNDFYSTNIFSIYPVAKHIFSLNIDARLKAGDITLVDDIKKVVISHKDKNFYSFATKYCSHHNPTDYPIYDYYVDKALSYFRKRDSFAEFSNDELKSYVRFKGLLIDFRAFYGLDKYSLKQIDKYIWQLGKEFFPRNYGKK